MPVNLRRFTEHGDPGAPYTLSEDHSAVVLGTSLYREGRLQSSAWQTGNIFKGGHNSRKIGAVVQKGRWKGFPIYTLTLEERATCPRSCAHWLDCYGNKMNWPTRWMADDDLILAIDEGLSALSAAHERFVVRLHILGDFFDLDYVAYWAACLDHFEGLHVYGYTAWQAGTPIGDAVALLARDNWNRFSIRTSNGEAATRTTKTFDEPDLIGIVDGAIICPAQTGQSECCATCALCWQTETPIGFLRH